MKFIRIAGLLGKFDRNKTTTDEALELFQYLIDHNLAFRMGGIYARIAQRLLDKGLVKKK